MDNETDPVGGAEDEPRTATQRIKFPTALTVLAIVMLAVWIASFLIPSGVYSWIPRRARRSRARTRSFPPAARVPAGLSRARTSASTRSSGSCGGRRRTASTASRTRTSRLVGADEEGFLYGSAQIFLFVLAIGAFITVTMKTGAIETGIGRLALRFRHSPADARARADGGLRARRHDATACGKRRWASSPSWCRWRWRLGYDRLVAVCDHLPRRRHRRPRARRLTRSPPASPRTRQASASATASACAS